MKTTALIMSLLGLSTTIIRQTVAQEPEPEEIAVSFIVDTACDVGAACSEERSTCNNGQTETCCGETFNSFECECYDGEYMCMYTDRCMYPLCETETLPTVVRASTVQSASIEGGGSSTLAAVKTSDTVVVAGIVEKGEPTPVEVLVEVDTACDVGATCEEGSTCNNGQTETCCGETFPSFVCECYKGEYMCMYTDMCMHPSCESPGEIETNSTVVVAGIVEKGDPSPVEVLVEGGDPSIIAIDLVQDTTSDPNPPSTLSLGGKPDESVVADNGVGGAATTDQIEGRVEPDVAVDQKTTTSDATTPVDNDGDTSVLAEDVEDDGPFLADDSSANGLYALQMVAVSMFSIVVSMMLA